MATFRGLTPSSGAYDRGLSAIAIPSIADVAPAHEGTPVRGARRPDSADPTRRAAGGSLAACARRTAAGRLAYASWRGS